MRAVGYRCAPVVFVHMEPVCCTPGRAVLGYAEIY